MATPNDTVIIGCKLPQGLLLKVDSITVRINGSARYNMPRPNKKSLLAGVNVHASDGLTQVDRGFWEKWCAEHADYGPLRDGFIYSSATQNKAKSLAEKTADVKTGFEPLDPNKPGSQLSPTEETLEMLKSPGGTDE